MSESDEPDIAKALIAAIPAPAGFVLPVDAGNIGGQCPLAFGLHLMPGVKASGKTVTSLALAAWIKAQGIPAHYEYVMEPRSVHNADIMAPGQWTAYLSNLLSAKERGVVIIDSLTYLVTRLNESTFIDKSLPQVTYSGGLSPRDILGILFHDAMARQAKVALVATLNAELFPVVEKMGGACEGEFILAGPGVFKHRDRTTRTFHSYDVPIEYTNWSFDTLKYPRLSSGLVDRY